MTSYTIAVLLSVHALAGTFWLGAMLINAGFLIPAVRATGAAGGQVMKYMVHARRLPAYINLAVIITLITGGILYWLASGGLDVAWLSSRYGMFISIGAIMTIGAAATGHLVNAPTAARLGQIGAAIQAAGAPPTPAQIGEMQRLQGKLARATEFAAVALALAAVAMVVGRYL